jgi:hypothetical protein
MSAEDLPEDGQAVLDRVREYRRAARKIVETEWASVQRRCLGLLELQDAARAEPDLTIRTWAERSIWEESKEFLGVDDDEPVAPPRSYEAAQRKLRNQQLERCPTCHASIATERDFDRWGRIRQTDAERRDAHDKAVQP